VKRYAGLAGLLLLVALPLVAQDPPATDPLSNADAALAKLDANSRYGIQLLIDSARAAGLPWKPLMSTALEGIAKQAPGRYIVVRVRKVLVALRDARAVLGPVSAEDLNAAASVIDGGGMKPDQLVAFKNPPRGRSLVTAFMVMGDFLTRGIPRDEASSTIAKLWRDGWSDADFMGLLRGVESDILQGLSPGASLQNRARDNTGRAPPKLTPPSGEPEHPSS
jgi:hypothetical protein